MLVLVSNTKTHQFVEGEHEVYKEGLELFWGGSGATILLKLIFVYLVSYRAVSENQVQA